KEQVIALLNEIESIETELKSIQGSIDALRFEIKIANQEIHTYEGQIKGKQTRLKNLGITIKKDLAPLGFEFEADPTTFNKLIKSLTDLLNAFLLKKEALSVAERDRVGHKREIETISRNLKSIQQKTDTRRKQLKQEQTRLELLTANRFKILGDKDPKKERQLFEGKIQELQQHFEEVRQSLQEVEVLREGLQAGQKKDLAQIKVLEREIQQSITTLSQQLRMAGFENITALKALALDEETYNDLSTKKSELHQKLLETKQSVKDLELQLEELKEKNTYDQNIVELMAELDRLRIEMDESLKEQGAITERINEHNKLKQKAQDLLLAVEKQNKEYIRWAKLNDIIGSSDGKKFRVFAQSLTLQKLIHLANLHLELLSGRYIIERIEGEDLSLEIVDRYQANYRRSMNTLSGGERFLVSLSLALGLSDLAGRNSKIQSLFIDEGFGTLDENTLDTVITTLENLQASGKTIGVISHVKDLKERIGTQIQVLKSQSGFSRLKIVG
ncbi:MAG: SbcC/MukB-like Walker B domain-containing protein, partial [Bacteroidota bacterium]